MQKSNVMYHDHVLSKNGMQHQQVIQCWVERGAHNFPTGRGGNIVLCDAAKGKRMTDAKDGRSPVSCTS